MKIESDDVLPLPTSVCLEHTLDGHKVENPRQLKKGLQRLGAIQKKLSRQRKGSSNRCKQKRLYARAHEKVRHQRHDFIHPLVRALEYKCERLGKNVIKIHRFSPSSKLCHVCGYRLETLALSVREWVCPSCLCMHDRDVNAAKNIRMIGLADSLGLSDCVKSSSVATSATARGVDILSA